MGYVAGELCSRDSGESDAGGGGNGLFKSVVGMGEDDIEYLLVGADSTGSAEIGD